MKKYYTPFLLILFTSLIAFGQTETTIESIRQATDRHIGENVVFEGFVTRYVDGPTVTTSFYEMQGYYGQRIGITTSGENPGVNNFYRITGILTIDQQGMPLVIETQRERLPAPDWPLVEPEPSTTITPPPTWWQQTRAQLANNQMMIALILALVIVLGLIIYFLAKSRQEKPAKSTTAAPPKPEPQPSEKPREEKTVIFSKDAPPTMKFIPGKLEILNGPDKGKTIPLAGYPTPEGSIVSIGRDYNGWESLVSGDRKHSHIRIKDESKTLSRMQAEIIYNDKKVYLKNLSKINPTQVDGIDVPADTMVEVKKGSEIKAGFIEFRYREN